jgi:hypothetical protein
LSNVFDFIGKKWDDIHNMSKDGFDNEKEILGAINGKKFVELNANLQTFIKDIFNFDVVCDDIISCEELGGINKPDIKVIFCGEIRHVSIKKGSGNSMHQEKLSDFIPFLNQKYSASIGIKNDVALFIWGDGTFDGSGNISSRLGATQFAVNYMEEIVELKVFFKEHKRELLKRFVIKGIKNGPSVDYIYYGTVEEGYWITAENAIDWLCEEEHEAKGVIAVGGLTFQAWNRNIKGIDRFENRRGQIQLKWGAIGKDIKNISENL